MPLKKSRAKNGKAFNKVVSENISELTHNGKRTRTHKQIVAISLNAARGGSKKKKK